MTTLTLSEILSGDCHVQATVNLMHNRDTAARRANVLGRRVTEMVLLAPNKLDRLIAYTLVAQAQTSVKRDCKSLFGFGEWNDECLVKKLEDPSYFGMLNSCQSNDRPLLYPQLLSYVSQNRKAFAALLLQIDYGRELDRFIEFGTPLTSEEEFVNSLGDAKKVVDALQNVIAVLSGIYFSLSLRLVAESLSALSTVIEGLAVYDKFIGVLFKLPHRQALYDYFQNREKGHDKENAWEDVVQAYGQDLLSVSIKQGINKDDLRDWFESAYRAYRLTHYRDSELLRQEQGKSMLLLAARPTLHVTPAAGSQLTSFTFTGCNYTSHGKVTRKLRKPDGQIVSLALGQASQAGTVNWTYSSKCTDATGEYTVVAVDNERYKESNPVTEAVTTNPGCNAQTGTLSSPTILLIDSSGSMADNNKIERARQAALETVDSVEQQNLQENTARPSIAIMTFAGGCVPDSTQTLTSFTTDLNQVRSVLRTQLPRPVGATPMPQAINRSIEVMNGYLATPGQQGVTGNIILIGDGQSTCPPQIRLACAYAGAVPVTGPALPLPQSPCPGNRGLTQILSQAAQGRRISFLTVGFDMAPGSAAERDLQYLASISGGKYFNAPDTRQLSRSLQKFLRVFVPKQHLVLVGADAQFSSVFRRGVEAMLSRNFRNALQSFGELLKIQPKDPVIIYNYAQALEATDHYKTAAAWYQHYLAADPAATDRQEIQRRIVQLREDYADHFKYYTDVLKSDVSYLKTYYQSLFNRSNAQLAVEFTGFVNEKAAFYAALADVLEVDAKWMFSGVRDLSESLATLARRVSLRTFDRDAVSLLTLPIGQLEELLGQLEVYAR